MAPRNHVNGRCFVVNQQPQAMAFVRLHIAGAVRRRLICGFESRVAAKNFVELVPRCRDRSRLNAHAADT